jgi:hypothetical protein
MRAFPASIRLLLFLAAGIAGWTVPVFDAARAAPILAPAELSAPPVAAAQSDPTVARSRYVAIDVAGLPAPLARPLSREPSLPLDLFPDRYVLAVFDRFDPNRTGVTWVGHVDGTPMSSITLVYSAGQLAGSIIMPGGVFSIRPAPADVRLANPQPAGDLHVVSEINQSAFPPEAPPLEVALSPAAVAAAAAVAPTDTADVIDVMVLYTPTALANAGGATAMTNLINLGISETNTSYANSQITQRVRLVHTAEVAYTEVSAFSTNLTSLRSGTGPFSGVPALRDLHRADLVALLVHPTSPDACGIAFVMTTVSTAFAPSGYSVTDTACVANSTVAHELGHNMGAQHDWYVSTAVLPFSHAHGYVDDNPGRRFRTIMAYPDRCTSQGFSCTRTLNWANPGVSYLPNCTGRGVNCALLQYWYFPGVPMGVPAGTATSCRAGVIPAANCDADDHRALNQTALTVANFRQTTPATSGR